jgi:hypothetical protein
LAAFFWIAAFSISMPLAVSNVPDVHVLVLRPLHPSGITAVLGLEFVEHVDVLEKGPCLGFVLCHLIHIKFVCLDYAVATLDRLPQIVHDPSATQSPLEDCLVVALL